MSDETHAVGLQRSRRLLIGLSAILVICCIIVASWVELRRSTFPAYPNPLSEFCVVFPLCAVVALIHKSIQRAMLPVSRCVVLKKDQAQHVYEHKLLRLGSVTFKLLFTSTLCYSTFETFLKDAEWMPIQMFGKGNMKSCWGLGQLLDTQAPIGIAGTRFYQIGFAYHLSELLLQIVYEPHKPDYVEMFIHHAATIFLIYVSFVANLARVGSLVLFLHYVSDIPGYAAKMFVDTKFKAVTAFCLVGVLVSWGYLRLYVFPFVIIKSTLLDTLEVIPRYGNAVYLIWFSCNVSLTALLCLHLYWYSLLLKMGWDYIKHGKTVDKQANLHKHCETNVKKD